MQHFYMNIDGWFSFSELYSFVVDRSPNPAHFVEVGVWKGRSAAYMAVEIINSNKRIKFDCVDTWEGSKEHSDDKDVLNGTLYECFIENMKPVESYYNPIRMTSIAASKMYEDESLDFVFIDASHDYQNVKNDILSWYPKVKIGGILAGHDYDWGTVRGAVHDLLHYKTLHTDNISWLVIKADHQPLVGEIVY